jgi:hypothetical protein
MNSIKVMIKPMSVNDAWKGRRFKSPEYHSYQNVLLLTLPAGLKLPPAPYEIRFIWGFSNDASDVDNPCKPFMDILQKKYGFNDSKVHRLVQEKEIVPKGEEFVEFSISTYLRGKETRCISSSNTTIVRVNYAPSRTPSPRSKKSDRTTKTTKAKPLFSSKMLKGGKS